LVAAVCYRVRSHGVLEFLLVQTRGGRWIFPKGGVEPGLTQAQSAALEAFEEAGVHGRIEEMPFARYYVTRGDRKSGKAKPKSRSKPDERSGKNTETMEQGEPVTAHLCEVSYLEPPQEADRNPTWFSPQKAKRRLLEGRSAKFGAELAGLVDRAVARIRRLEAAQGRESRKDELQQARFQGSESRRLQAGGNDAAMARYLLLKQRRLRSSVLEVKGSTTLH
jgi:8-oxo-dGTP pyrophosphatase MutT (NUDIX family)